MMTSHCCHPSASISARVVGRKAAAGAKAAAGEPAAVALRQENKGPAVCIAASISLRHPKSLVQPKSLASPHINGDINLSILALDQNRDAVPCTRDLALQIRHGRHARTIDSEYDVAGLQTRGERRAADVLHDQSTASMQLLLFIRFQGTHGKSQFAAAVSARGPRGLSRRVLQQYRLDIHFS